jgi:hypothetical protein
LVATIQLPEEGRAVGVNPRTGLGDVGMTDDVGVLDLDSYQYLTAGLLTSGCFPFTTATAVPKGFLAAVLGSTCAVES